MGDAIDAASVESAIALTDWHRAEALRVLGLFSETPEDRDRRRLVDWLRQQGGETTARDVQRGCRWLWTPGDAEAALVDLEKNRLAERRTRTTGGRPRTVFFPPGCRQKVTFSAENDTYVDVDTWRVRACASPDDTWPDGSPLVEPGEDEPTGTDEDAVDWTCTSTKGGD